MGTTADKLNKLLQTKEDIKAAIQSTGETVLDDDTFASYADKIRNDLVKPSGTQNITDTSRVDVSDKQYAQVVDAKLTASNIKDGVTILGIQGTYKPDLNMCYTGTDDPSASLGKEGDIYIKTFR